MFLHDEQKLGERWLLQGGVRYDWNSRTDQALSPRAAIIFNPAGEHYFRLFGGLAFRKPSPMETSMNFEVEANPAFPEIEDLFEKYGISNPDLKNELLSSVEFGWNSSWLEGRLKTSLNIYSVFNRHLIDFQTDVVFEDKPLGPRINLEKSRVGYEDLLNDYDAFGASFSLETRPWDWLSLFLRSEVIFSFWSERDYSRRRSSPPYLIAAGASFLAPLGIKGQIVLAGQGESSDHRRNPESIFLPSVDIILPAIFYTILYLGRDFDAGPIKLHAAVEFFDAFNHRFREVGGTLDKNAENFGGELLGRRFIASLGVIY